MRSSPIASSRARYLAAALGLIAYCWHAGLGGGNDWWTLRFGAQLLFDGHHVLVATQHGHPVFASDGGLHLYGRYPQVQVGPLALLLLRLALVLGSHGSAAAGVLTALLFVPALWAFERAAAAAGATLMRPVSRWLVTLVAAAAWYQYVSWSHVDDALVVTAIALACWAYARDRPVLLAVALGLAVLAKPTAMMALVLLLAVRGRRRLALAALVVAGVVAAGWLPFVIADPATLSAGAYRITIQPDSPLRFLAGSGELVPHWVRPTQLALAWVVGGLAAKTGRWYAVPVVVMCCRLAIEPGNAGYYAASVVACAVLWDLMRGPRGLPWLTCATSALLLLVGPVGIDAPEALAVVRLVGTAAGALLPFVVGRGRRRPGWVPIALSVAARGACCPGDTGSPASEIDGDAKDRALVGRSVTRHRVASAR